ncbi:MAG TPA: hypothetical protein V6C89_17725 [Drouetiella sp.]|jgi:hypothetical protein
MVKKAGVLKALSIHAALTMVLLVMALQSEASAQSPLEAGTEAVVCQPKSDQAPLPEGAETRLKGFAEFADTKAPDYTGTWKGHVIEFHRHPKIFISEQNGNQLNGTYSGLLGKFPLTGLVDQVNETVKFTVDFSHSKLARWKKRETVIALFDGSIKNQVITGLASIPEFGNKVVHFEAKKLIKAEATESTTDQNQQL